MSLICPAERLIVSYWFELSSLEDSHAGFSKTGCQGHLVPQIFNGSFMDLPKADCALS